MLPTVIKIKMRNSISINRGLIKISYSIASSKEHSEALKKNEVDPYVK